MKNLLLVSFCVFVFLLLEQIQGSADPLCSNGDSRFVLNLTLPYTKYGSNYIAELRGFLEICYNGTYYGVCSGEYDQQVAEVTCTSLGYTGSKLFLRQGYLHVHV